MKSKIPILTITLLGLLLRLFRLGYHDLWFDEVCSIFSAMDSPRTCPHLFYAILHFWIKLFGQSEFSVRLPALICSTLSIPSIYILGKKLFTPKVGIIAAIILTLSPFQIWYAQEARHYSVGLFFSIISTYFLIMAIKEKSRYWLYFILVSILGMYSGEVYIFLLITQLILCIIYSLFTSNRSEIKNSLLSLLLISFCFMPVVNKYLQKLTYIRGDFWVPQPDVSSLIITFENLLIGYNLSQMYYFFVDILILILLFAVFKLILNNKDVRNNFYICLFLTAFPIIAIYIFSRLIVSIYLDRCLIIFSPCYYILLSLGIENFSRRKRYFFIYPALCFLFIIGLKSFYQDYMPTPFKHHMGTYIKKPIKPLIKFIEENPKFEDIVGFTNPSTRPSFQLYANTSRRYYEFFDPKLPGDDCNHPIKESTYRVPKQKIPFLKAERIWIIASNWSHDGGLDEQSKSVKEYLDKEMMLKLSKNIHGNWLFLYEHK